MSQRRRIIEVLDPSEMALLEARMLGAVTKLSEREVGVLRLRYGNTDGEPRTLDEIARVYGVGPERIREILKRTMSKLDLDF